MAGYSGYSKSNNAIAAEQEGLFPASVLARKLRVSTEAIKSILVPEEWHHTSSWYNRTDYYSLEEAEVKLQQLKAFAAPRKQEKYKADVAFLVWSGTRKHPKAKEINYTDIEVTEKGSYYVFATPLGNVRKKIGSNGTKVRR